MVLNYILVGCPCGGISDEMFKRHGRLRSENAKDGYVKDLLESRLAVSMSLGL